MFANAFVDTPDEEGEVFYVSGSVTDERPTLSRAAIVAAARRIADGEGLAALTLRRIAAEFGTGQASCTGT